MTEISMTKILEKKRSKGVWILVIGIYLELGIW
jgi:hypothetical protein